MIERNWLFYSIKKISQLRAWTMAVGLNLFISLNAWMQINSFTLSLSLSFGDFFRFRPSLEWIIHISVCKRLWQQRQFIHCDRRQSSTTVYSTLTYFIVLNCAIFFLFIWTDQHTDSLHLVPAHLQFLRFSLCSWKPIVRIACTKLDMCTKYVEKITSLIQAARVSMSVYVRASVCVWEA